MASDLSQLFGSLTNVNVAEIGIGYGGQCRVVKTVWSVAHYQFFDIPEVLALADRFLRLAGFDPLRDDGSDGRNTNGGNFDLLISNYAFSELRRETQEEFWDTVVKHSSRGYLTYNHITPAEWGSLSAYDLAARIPGAQVLPERPLTHPTNVVVAWGMSN